MTFSKVTKDCFYIETDDEFHRKGDFDYLFESKGDQFVDPPSGMRSALPLGGIGVETVDLRAGNEINISASHGNDSATYMP